MLGRVDRYVINELLMALMAVTVVMLVVVLGGVMADTLSKIARGKVAAALLLSQIGLRSLEALVLILPLALFLGVLLGLGRLYRDGEMAVLAASGYGPRQLLKPIAIVTLPLAFVLALLSFIAVKELTLNAQEVSAYTYSTMESYLPLAVGYLILTLPISLWTRWLENRTRYET